MFKKIMFALQTFGYKRDAKRYIKAERKGNYKKVEKIKRKWRNVVNIKLGTNFWLCQKTILQKLRERGGTSQISFGTTTY